MEHRAQFWDRQYGPDCRECDDLEKKNSRLRIQLQTLESEAGVVLALLDDWRARGKLEISPEGPGAEAIERLRTLAKHS